MRKNSYHKGVGQEKFILRLLNDQIMELIKAIHTNNNGTVLDVGCGNQPFRSVFNEEGWQYESLDISQNEFKNVDHICKIDGQISIKKKYNLLFCTEVLEHVLNWDKAFSNFNHLLKNKGYLLLTTPFFFPPHEEPHDYWRPTKFAIEEFARKNSFKIIESYQAGDAWDLLGTLCYSIYLKPKNRRLKSKLLYMVLYKAQKWLRQKLEQEIIQKNIEIESKYYLSNIFLLRKENI